MPIGLFCECKKTKNLQHKNKNKSKVFYAPIPSSNIQGILIKYFVLDKQKNSILPEYNNSGALFDLPFDYFIPSHFYPFYLHNKKPRSVIKNHLQHIFCCIFFRLEIVQNDCIDKRSFKEEEICKCLQRCGLTRS